MATIEVSGPELLKAVLQLGPDELDAFLEKALLLRNQPRGTSSLPRKSSSSSESIEASPKRRVPAMGNCRRNGKRIP
jgi:hypothetical protein